jgi:hypothetical protein
MTFTHSEIGPRAGQEAAQPAFEPRDLPARAIVRALLGLFGGIAVVGFLVAGLFALLAHTEMPSGKSTLEMQRQEPPAPRLEVAPSADRAAVEAAAQRKLQGYAWTNRAAGRARIPIKRAMQLTAGQGWPDSGPQNPGPP